MKRLRLISKNHSEGIVKSEVGNVLKGVRGFRVKLNAERLSFLSAAARSFFMFKVLKVIFEDWVENHVNIKHEEYCEKKALKVMIIILLGRGCAIFNGIEKNRLSEKVRKLAGIASLNLKIQRYYEKNLRKG